MRRTLLFLPGNNPGMIRDAHIYGADSIMFDLEDSVAYTEKDAARLLVASALKSVDYAGVERAVRINTLATGGEADIAAVVPCRPDAVMLPKTESIDDIRACEALLEEAEAACGAAKKTLIMPLIETPMGLARCPEIALASKRVTLLSLGGEDYTASLGTQRTREGRELIFARGMLANAAAAAGIDSIDAPFADTNDPEGLFLDTQNARTFGFKGKFAINPRQISVIHKAFAPTAKEIAWAKRILVVIEEAQKKGAGVIALDGAPFIWQTCSACLRRNNHAQDHSRPRDSRSARRHRAQTLCRRVRRPPLGDARSAPRQVQTAGRGQVPAGP